MAKASYKWPKDLSMTSLDIVLSIKNENGAGLRPMPLRTLLAILVSLLLGSYLTFSSPIGAGGVLAQVLFGVGWTVATVALIRQDATGEPGYKKIGLLSDMRPARREVVTRTSANATDFYYVSDIDSVDEETGLIRFVDGSLGYAYRVNGSASVLLFDDDRDAVLDRVAAFYASMGMDYELIWMTCVEPQRVDRQVASMEGRMAEESDPDLRALAATERDTLVTTVGEQYRSISQYLIVKGRTPDGLANGRARLQHEVESSSLMLSRCKALYDDELHRALALPFRYERGEA